MKFLTLENGQLGALIEDTVVDLPQASRGLNEDFIPGTLLQLIETGEAGARHAWQLAKTALEKGTACRPFSEVKPLAPIPEPIRNIICLGKNYRDHAKEIAAKVETAEDIPSKPIYFTKATTQAIGSGAPIPSHSNVTNKLDYETELAIVIAKAGSNIPKQQALDYVFGYTILNDVSARDLQTEHAQWFKGKSLDGFAPMGPVLVHHSVMPAPEEVELKCWVNGEQRQQARLDQLIFDIPTIISDLSTGMTLLSGDIIATGTPAGVGMGFNPPRYLHAGDEIIMEITAIGRLINRVE